MKAEFEARLKDNPKPTEQELYMGAFTEWLEPQVRDAMGLMYRKGYATTSSGFHGEDYDLQTVDGNFAIDEQTKLVLRALGVEVLRGADIGVPKNKFVTVLRFRASDPSLSTIKRKWDALAAVLPKKSFPQGIRPICDRAEEFRTQYAPDHPSLAEACEKYYEYRKRQWANDGPKQG
jgi:hypothetical protein